MRMAFPSSLVLTPVSRWPTRLRDETVQVALASRDADLALPTVAESDGALEPRVSIVIPTCNNLVFVTLCLRSLLANTEYPGYEVVVIDNGSTDGTPGYLRELMGRHPRVRGIFNEVNRGFAAANNQGLAVATGDVLVLLNDDTMVPPGLLLQLVKHLDDPDIGLVGPVTNRAGNEAQIETSYRTYGEMVRFTGARARTHAGQLVDLRTLTMFESPDIKVGRSQRTGSTCAVSPAHLSSSNNHRLNTLRRLLAAAEQAFPQPERGLRRRPSTEARKYCSGRSQKNP